MVNVVMETIVMGIMEITVKCISTSSTESVTIISLPVQVMTQITIIPVLILQLWTRCIIIQPQVAIQ